jgi:hypothetical protein
MKIKLTDVYLDDQGAQRVLIAVRRSWLHREQR